eukprot:CAMPEP_0170640612 /NCGR_PEP_ID=MMETSP0224-20130122/40322_1 /TAXON_ID=285029 /ORGANISM="Togula jolla, Strain CCCM 725" /LENGTH=258 /DNA_ID=CAMNT_0010971139 /DNA_START=105 /DNA_END=879 /DNA_ORIENTATION=-
MEVCARFGAFRSKMQAFKDRWFIFDTALVTLMVLETWMLPLLGGGISDALSDFSLLRMLRLMRLTRMVHIMRSVPELVTLLKGMAIAATSVMWTLVLFKNQLSAAESPALRLLYSSIPEAMWSLMLAGCLVDNISEIATEHMEESFFIGCLFMFFVFLTALMVFGMLTGLLCAVVNAVAAAEKEKVLVTFVKLKIRKILLTHDTAETGQITKDEFEELLLMPAIFEALNDLGVDVDNLASVSDQLFQHAFEDKCESEL